MVRVGVIPRGHSGDVLGNSTDASSLHGNSCAPGSPAAPRARTARSTWKNSSRLMHAWMAWAKGPTLRPRTASCASCASCRHGRHRPVRASSPVDAPSPFHEQRILGTFLATYIRTGTYVVLRARHAIGRLDRGKAEWGQRREHQPGDGLPQQRPRPDSGRRPGPQCGLHAGRLDPLHLRHQANPSRRQVQLQMHTDAR